MPGSRGEDEASLIDRRQVLRMIGLQVRGDDTHSPLEYLERHTRLNSSALDAPSRRHAVVTIQSSQERGLAGTISSVNDPAFAGTNLERSGRRLDQLTGVA